MVADALAGRFADHGHVDDITPVLDQLPVSYAVALRMHRSGATNETIAEALGLEVEAIPSHLEIGRAKALELVGRTGRLP